MKFRFRKMTAATLTWTLACVLCASAGMAQAEEEVRRKKQAPSAPASAAAARGDKAWVPADTRSLVDINSARKAQLAKLPGMNDELAAKVIAGRPYGSKMHLVTRQVLPPEVFDAVRGHVVARQPYKDQAKNVEALKKAGKASP